MILNFLRADTTFGARTIRRRLTHVSPHSSQLLAHALQDGKQTKCTTWKHFQALLRQQSFQQHQNDDYDTWPPTFERS